MSEFFPSEKKRTAALEDVLAEHGIEMAATVISGTEYTTDGDMQLHLYRYLIAEIKNEIGSKAAEPYAQAILYHYHSTKNKALENPMFNFPCFVLTVFGEWLVPNVLCSLLTTVLKGLISASPGPFGVPDRTTRYCRLSCLCFGIRQILGCKRSLLVISAR